MEQILCQKQKLVITHTMEQQLSLLHMPIMDIETYLIDQALENPLIDIESFNDKKKTAPTKEYDKQDWINNIAQPPNLYDYLIGQLGLLKLDPFEREIIEYLIYLIDENGYFHGDISEISKRFTTPYKNIEKLLFQLQTLDPIGIGAQNLKECILIQLKAMDNKNELVELVVSNYFELLIDRKWKDISGQLGVDITEIQCVFDFIKTLNLRPGSDFQQEVPEQIKPELYVIEASNGFKVMINESVYPILNVDPYYKVQLGSLTDNNSNYIKDKYNQLVGLQQALNKRKKTIVNVMKAIVDQQIEFFKKGRTFLKPLTIREIAETVGVHESTVSRAVNGKYVQTSHGLFELKSFFTSGIVSKKSEDVSSDVVKQAISKLVERENKCKPLSDQRITQLLIDNEGLDISRRTVAKYREQFGDPIILQTKTLWKLITCFKIE